MSANAGCAPFFFQFRVRGGWAGFESVRGVGNNLRRHATLYTKAQILTGSLGQFAVGKSGFDL